MAVNAFQDRGPAAAHALEGGFSQRRIEVETGVLKVQASTRALGLKTPGDGRIERSGCEAITQQTLGFHRDDFARLLPPGDPYRE